MRSGFAVFCSSVSKMGAKDTLNIIVTLFVPRFIKPISLFDDFSMHLLCTDTWPNLTTLRAVRWPLEGETEISQGRA